MAEKTIVASSASRSMVKLGSNYTTQHNAATADELRTILYVVQLKYDANYSILRSALIFDTSGIPANTSITSVIMQIKPDIWDGEKNWDIVIRNGQPTYPHNPVVVGDYLYSHYSDDGGSVDVSTLDDLAWNDITLNSTGRGWIQKTGTTKLVLISSKDISSTAPTTVEQVHFGYTDIRIVVTYTTVVTITTQVPTNIERADPTTLTANALIELDVAEDITTRGFQYGLTETPTWSEYEEGTFSEGTFSLTLTGLDADTTYYIRAYAIVAEGYGTTYGSYVKFKTAYPYGANKVEIKSETTASASDIAAVGGKRSLTIENHLIQNQTIADLISAAYLADYKDQKTKLVITKPCPAPYEIGDTIERGAGISYAPAATAVISYAPAATAVHPYQLAGHDMLIRKISISFSAGNYVSIIELES